MLTFCQRLQGRKCQERGVGGKKTQDLVNVVYERPLGIFKPIRTSHVCCCFYRQNNLIRKKEVRNSFSDPVNPSISDL